MSASAVQTSIKTALGALPSKFSKARSSGALYFFDSEVKDVEQDGNRFQIRVCPALQDKAKAKREADAKVGNNEQDQAEPNKSSPFEPPYVEDLFVGDLQGSQGEEGMAMLLNKYAVLPEHLLLCTKTQQPQSSPPTPHQLLLTYLTIHAASKHSTNRKRLLAFYNGGEGAGASQTWRHLQCIEVPRNEGAPIEEWVEDLEVERKDKPFVNTRLPHLHLMHHLPPAKNLSSTWTDESLDKMEMSLASAMVSLLDAMYDALRRNNAGRDGGWNLLMTLDHLHLIPRSKPNYQLPGGSKLEVNSLAFAGMLLVKSNEELELLNKTTETNENGGTQGLMRVLEHCGVPRAWGEWEEAAEGTLAEPVQQQL